MKAVVELCHNNTSLSCRKRIARRSTSRLLCYKQQLALDVTATCDDRTNWQHLHRSMRIPRRTSRKSATFGVWAMFKEKCNIWVSLQHDVADESSCAEHQLDTFNRFDTIRAWNIALYASRGKNSFFAEIPIRALHGSCQLYACSYRELSLVLNYRASPWLVALW